MNDFSCGETMPDSVDEVQVPMAVPVANTERPVF